MSPTQSINFLLISIFFYVFRHFYVGPERDNFPVTASGYVGNAGMFKH